MVFLNQNHLVLVVEKVVLQLMPPGDSIDKGRGYDDMISCTVVVSVSTSYSRCHNLTWSSLSPHVLHLMYASLLHRLQVYIA